MRTSESDISCLNARCLLRHRRGATASAPVRAESEEFRFRSVLIGAGGSPGKREAAAASESNSIGEQAACDLAGRQKDAENCLGYRRGSQSLEEMISCWARAWLALRIGLLGSAPDIEGCELLRRLDAGVTATVVRKLYQTHVKHHLIVAGDQIVNGGVEGGRGSSLSADP